jgi:hypothetical protein
MTRNASFGTLLATVAASFACTTMIARAHPLLLNEDVAQLKADVAALGRQMRRLSSDEATLRAESRHRKRAAASRDAAKVYGDTLAVNAKETELAEDLEKLRLDQAR